MITEKELYSVINEIAPFEDALDWDNAGLLINLDNGAERILFALDATRAVIDEAVSLGCKIIVTHHPIVFNPVRSFDISDGYVYAMTKGISVISAHTNWDVAKGGVNDYLCSVLGIRSAEVFMGEGRMGDIDETTGAELARKVKTTLDAATVKVINAERSIKRVAVVGGSAGTLFLDAAKQGCDAFITGELKHMEETLAESNGICVIEAGHFETESPSMKAFCERVQTAIGDSAKCLLSAVSKPPYIVVS